MPNIYVRSPGFGGLTGADWANACATIAAGITASSPGDDIWVSEDHAETQASALTLAFKGTPASPNRCICVNHSGSVPPVSADLRTTATVTTTGAMAQSHNGCCYLYGITFNIGTGTTAASSTLGGGTQSDLFYDACALKHLVTSATIACTIGAAATGVGQRVILSNTVINFNGNASSGVRMDNAVFIWRNTPSAALGGTQTAINNGFSTTLRTGAVLFDGLDLTFIASGKNIVTGPTNAQSVQVINCKFTAGAVFGTPAVPGGSTDVILCDSGALNYRQERYQYQGTLTAEATIVRTGGASDGTTPISWKIVSTANAKRQSPFESFPYAEWIDTTGSAVTRTFELVNDGVTLTNADVWVELEYLSNASFPLVTLLSSAPADALNTGASITTSTATWTTTGLTTPVKQKIALTFTPLMKGLFRAIIKVGKASQTLYVDPKPSELP